MFARCPNIGRSLIVTMVCCLLGEVLALRAQGQAIEVKGSIQVGNPTNRELMPPRLITT
jgi:hypothetical protein